jgi:two-component system copper resistance phosphate regulon response regulator CusR
MKILVIEDEPKTGDCLCKGLNESCFAVNLARTGIEGEMLALSDEYGLIVLDVMLPGRDGWQILQTLRKSNPVPVLFLSARDAVEDRVRGLDLGADDYLPQPFAFAELLARIRSLFQHRYLLKFVSPLSPSSISSAAGDGRS